MPLVIRLLFYLSQFYLFAVTGVLAYLSARAWLDRNVAGPTVGGPRLMGNWGHFVRALAFATLTFASMLGALYQGNVGIRMDGVSIARYCAYIAVLSMMPRSLRFSPRIAFAVIFLIAGEVITAHLVPTPPGAAALDLTYSFAATALLALGTTLIVTALKGQIIRVLVRDRLVIAFAIMSLLVAQLVVGLFLSLVISLDVTRGQMQDILRSAESPMIITLVVVLVLSAIIGYFVARDITAPMNRIEKALRAIGRGELDFRLDINTGGQDEMHDLAKAVNRMAESLSAAETMRSDFLSFVSHELRSPLTSIRGFIQTLEADPSFSEEDRMDIYQIIHDEADRLLRMIGELLDVARIQAGTPITLVTQRFDSARHIQKVAEIMRAHTQKHVLEVVRPSGPVPVVADPDKFDQIVINLLSNAIKYSPDGGKIVITLEPGADNIRIAIEDTGVGMTPDQAAHVFDKFYRVSDKVRVPRRLARVEGSGIGLYLTRALVEAHHGRIEVSSQEGVGSTFTVTLPRTIASDDAGDAASGSMVVEQETPSPNVPLIVGPEIDGALDATEESGSVAGSSGR
ncbi:MAG: HAMP domain-containing sensor histidine kinase [Capsulimonadaceae bacterium]|nr:HAMP domain-containing sensor histidine kinase [Capsulimonadaceae bacterium]